MTKIKTEKTVKGVIDTKEVCIGFINHALPRKTYIDSNILLLFALKEIT